MESKHDFPGNKLLVILFMLIFVSTISQVTADLYLPSLPYIADSLAVDVHLAQFTMTLYMIGLCISQLVYGPISDALGRRSPLVLGLVLNVIGCLMCWFAPHINLLYLGRFLQGFGTGAGAVLARSILRDLFVGEKLAKYNSILAIASVVILALAPVLGGVVQYSLGWRMNFAILTIYALLVLFAFYLLVPETNQHLHPENWKPSVILKNCQKLLKSRVFLRYAFCPFLTYGGILAWLTATPVLLQETVGLNPAQFGLVYIVSGVGFAIGGTINAMLVWRFKIEAMMYFGFMLQLVAGLIMLAGYGLGYINVWSIVPPIGVYMIGSSLVFPNSSAGAFGPFSKIAGTAGAVFGFLQVFGGAVASAALAIMPDTNQLPIALAFLISAILAWGFYFFLSD